METIKNDSPYHLPAELEQLDNNAYRAWSIYLLSLMRLF